MSNIIQEADLGLGPFMLSPARAAVAEYSIPIWTGTIKMVSGLRGLKVDPWGFLLPLKPMVWVATLSALLGILVVHLLISTSLPGWTLNSSGWPANTSSCVRVILQQGEATQIMLSFLTSY